MVATKENKDEKITPTSFRISEGLLKQFKKYCIDSDLSQQDAVALAMERLMAPQDYTVEKLGSVKLSSSDQRAATAFLKWWNTPPRDEKQTAFRVAIAALLGIQSELSKEELRKLKFWAELGKD